jgi:hypothetical protein
MGDKPNPDRVHRPRVSAESAGHMTSAALAELIVDALIVAKLVAEEESDRAIAIAAEEIEVRKAMGDY